MAKMGEGNSSTTGMECIFISARERNNIDALRTLLYNKVRELHVQKYPYNDFFYPNDME
jgi:GTP-binding protein HflX